MSTIDASERLPRLLSIDALADHLGVTERFVRRLVEDNRVPYLKIGKFVRFHPDDINAWLENTRIEKRHDT
jgi:excisionase family DNA binding protein